MLKKFFLNALSSFVGTWMAFVLLIIAGILIVVAGVVSIGGKEGVKSLNDNTLLVIDLDGVIVEREMTNRPDISSVLNGDIEKPQALNILLESIRIASNSDKIKGIYLKCGSVQAGAATLDEIRNEIKEFKSKSGKKVIAYGDSYSLGSYFVASVADKILLNPYGSISMQGIGGSSMFYKSLFDKLGIQFQVVKVGTFKSAVEPYISTQMSEPARAQLDTLYSSMWSYIKNSITSNRKALTSSKIDSLVNHGIGFAPAEQMVKVGAVDELAYERTVDMLLSQTFDIDKDDIQFVAPSDVINNSKSSMFSSKNKIAVLYASGEIVDGASSGINYQSLVPIITELADDDDVKGLVLRVNSPGGSAFGSDQIGEALDYFKSKNKKFAVSMGDYAASGGYWISCTANKIFADPLTITGSIGIFGLIPNVKGLADKVGVNVETVSTNPDAVFPTLYQPLSPNQIEIVQSNVERGYNRFIARVAKGRNMSESKVRMIAEGRVWDAIKAKQIGLVDELGNLQSAINWIASATKLDDDYSLEIYPSFEPTIWDMIPYAELNSKIGASYDIKELERVRKEIVIKFLKGDNVWARMPEFKVEI